DCRGLQPGMQRRNGRRRGKCAPLSLQGHSLRRQSTNRDRQRHRRRISCILPYRHTEIPYSTLLDLTMQSAFGLLLYHFRVRRASFTESGIEKWKEESTRKMEKELPLDRRAQLLRSRPLPCP